MSARLEATGVRLLSLILTLAIAGVACAPYQQRIDATPTILSGDRAPVPNSVAAAPRNATVDAERAGSKRVMDSLAAHASSSCGTAPCDEVVRGAVLLGMSENQLYAATRSAAPAWSMRRAGATTTMVPASRSASPRDAVGELSLIQFDHDRVVVIAYRDGDGVRLVTGTTTSAGAARDRALATALQRDGDERLAAADSSGALDRYDEASALMPRDADLQFRIARILDAERRPVEALIHYERFVRALTDATHDARLAAALERIAVLSRQVAPRPLP